MEASMTMGLDEKRRIEWTRYRVPGQNGRHVITLLSLSGPKPRVSKLRDTFESLRYVGEP